MSKVLFLDDKTERHDSFMRYCEDHVTKPILVAHCWDYEQFTTILDREPYDWDVFFLDHDLGLTSLTGMDAVNYLIAANIRPKMVVVHSWNPGPAKEMRLELDRMFIKNLYIPFGYDYPPEIWSYLQ